MPPREKEELDREGTFRGLITEYGCRKTEGGAIQLSVYADIEEEWDPQLEAWVDWREYQRKVSGDLNLVKKDGTINKTQVQALVNHTNWDGNFTSFSQETFKPTPCQFVVKQNTYNDNTRYRIEWINAYDRVPGAFTPLDADTAKALQNKLGGEMRALVGNVVRQERKPTGTPAAPPKAPAPPSPAEQSPENNADVPGDDIPF